MIAPYVYAQWAKARVNIDCHIEVEGHYYSTPYPLVHEPVDVRLTPATIEVFFKSRRVASHARSFLKGQYTTTAEHLPPQHQNYLKWTPERIIGWTQKIGPHTALVAQEILQVQSVSRTGIPGLSGFDPFGRPLFLQAFGSRLSSRFPDQKPLL